MILPQSEFIIAPEQISTARAERARHEAIIASSQRRIAAIDQFLSAAALLSGEGQEPSAESAKPPISEAAPSHAESNVMALIENLANHSNRPMAKSELKTHLLEAGIHESRLKSYFYVAIDRLKRKGRVTVLHDGRLWRAGYVEPQHVTNQGAGGEPLAGGRAAPLEAAS
jgi:hypothetical protein